MQTNNKTLVQSKAKLRKGKTQKTGFFRSLNNKTLIQSEAKCRLLWPLLDPKQNGDDSITQIQSKANYRHPVF